MYAQIYADPPAASARRAGIPSAIDSVLATALAKDPAGRYPSCGLFAEELRTALGLRPSEPADPPQSPAPRGNGPVSRPWPASAGRQILRVRQKQRPGAEDAQAAAKDSHAVAADRPAGSYTVSLLDHGIAKISQKVGEEAIEVVVAANAEDDGRLAAESALEEAHVEFDGHQRLARVVVQLARQAAQDVFHHGQALIRQAL